MASVFQKELNLMQNLIGTNAKATFELNRGVEVVDIAGYKWEQSGRKLTIQVPDVYSGETKRMMVQLKVPTDSGKSIALGSGQFVCTDISKKQPVLFTANFQPSVKVISDINMVKNNEDKDMKQRSESIIASRDMEKAYALYEEGKADEAQVIAGKAVQRLKTEGAGNVRQIERYDMNLTNISPTAPAPASEPAKDFLKKQKEAERNLQQTEEKDNQ